MHYGRRKMPSRPWESLGLRPRDPLGSGGHDFFSNNALAGLLILILTSTPWSCEASKTGAGSGASHVYITCAAIVTVRSSVKNTEVSCEKRENNTQTLRKACI